LKNTPFTDLDWEDIIDTSIQIKNKIVLADPFEKGERKKLNFGHTFGHSIESYYLEKGTPISHGEAVFMGMILETKISDLSESDKNEIKNYVLSNFALPYTPKKSSLHKFLINDKKNQNGKINFTLLNGIGDCSFDNLFSLDEL
jgi:3-dehydroquinate synthase